MSMTLIFQVYTKTHITLQPLMDNCWSLIQEVYISKSSRLQMTDIIYVVCLLQGGAIGNNLERRTFRLNWSKTTMRYH